MTYFDRYNFELRESLGQYIHFLNQYKDRILNAHPDMQGITPAQFKVLLLLSRSQMLKPSDLCESLQIDSAAITRMLDRLEDKGLIQRERSTVDRRQINIKLSEEGLNFAKHIPQIAADTLNTLTQMLSKEETALLHDLMRKILSHGGVLPQKND